LRGGSDKLKEANTALAGGHTVIDPKEIKYGLSVTGVIDPKRMFAKGGLEGGNKLILTKSLGTGIINNALKGDMVDEETQLETVRSMAALNKRASELAIEAGVRTCTDITGFGLAGHLLEMTKESEGVGVEIESSSFPLFSRVGEFAKMGLIPPGTQRNRKAQEGNVIFSDEMPEWKQWIVFDAQTSGGLLISLPPKEAEDLIKRMHDDGLKEATIIGRVVDEHPGVIEIR